MAAQPRPGATRRQFLAAGVVALGARAEDGESLQRQIAADRHRPQYHIAPPAHFLNDPNGLLYWKGRYHLFYQYAPRGGMFGAKSWYHTVSEDLVHWKNLGVALAPAPDGPDKDGCWSGSAVIHNGVPTLVYTGACFQGPNEFADRTKGLVVERQMVAVAADPRDPDLLKWTKIPENPVLAAPPEGMAVTGWRDPALWREAGAWYMVIGAGVRGGAALTLLYRSGDLRKWEYLHPLAADKPVPGQRRAAVWECPDFFRLGGKAALLTAHQNRCLIGSYRDLKFEQESEGRIDYGAAYAQKTMQDARGRRIWWAWIRENPRAASGALWSGAISLPRVLTLDQGGQLGVAPLPELKSLRAEHDAVGELTVTEAGPALLNRLKGDCTEIVAEIDLRGAKQAGLRVRATPDLSEQTLIGYDRTEGTLFSDAGQRGKAATRAPLHLGVGQPLRLHVFLDASVIETFANGRIGLIDRVYPSSPEALGIGVFSRGGSAVVRSLSVWRLRPISSDRLTSGPLT